MSALFATTLLAAAALSACGGDELFSQRTGLARGLCKRLWAPRQHDLEGIDIDCGDQLQVRISGTY